VIAFPERVQDLPARKEHARERVDTSYHATTVARLQSMTAQTPALTGIRTGAHPGFDRVVLDFGPGPQPTFTQQQVDELTADASGEVVWLTGLTFTAVSVHGAHDGGSYTGPAKFRTHGLTNVVAIAETGDFEDVLSIGIGERRATTVTLEWLTGPNRLVIDVTH